MLRTYFMQQWFDLSDPGIEDEFYASARMRRFAGIDLGANSVPDKTTMLRFRRLPESTTCAASAGNSERVSREHGQIKCRRRGLRTNRKNNSRLGQVVQMITALCGCLFV
jgi:IS5 family transposase